MDIAKLYSGTYSPTDITRESFFNIGGPHGFMRWAIYLLMFAAFIYLFYTLIQRVRLWRQAKPELRTDYHEKRIVAFMKYVVFQAKILRESFPGIMHVTIFWGFVGLFLVTMLIMIQDDLTELFFHVRFLYGNFYIYWSLFADLCGLVVLAGLAMAFWRRYWVKPSRLDNKMMDTFALSLIAVIIVSGFTTEGLRIAMSNFPAFEVWSPVGYVTGLAFSWMGHSALSVVHYISWWIHVLGAFVFIGLVASDKLGHILISTLNVYFMNLKNESAKTKYTMPIISPAEFETAESFGVGSVEQFTWKQLMDSDACTRCGRCQDNCPAHLTEKPLSPKKIQQDTKKAMDERMPLILAAKKAAEDPASVDLTAIESKMLIGEHVLEDEIWSCTNCAACMEACPVNIEHVPKINDMRRYKVLMEGVMATELQSSLQNMETNFSPYPFGFAERADWITDELRQMGLKTLEEDANVDYVYFVGCAASFDQKKNQKVAIALCKVLMKAGLKIGVLGVEEACCGDSAIRAGNEYLFHTLAAMNLENFKKYNVKKIITACPHGYNVLKKEYREFAKVGVDSSGQPLEANYEVYHHSEVIADLIKSGKIKVKQAIADKITYHDSCFLGRYNEIYDQPRSIVKALAGPQNFVEMSRNHAKSFCCGAGGARMWIEEHLGTRINQFRTKDAQSSGAATIATACPFCLIMLSDGADELEIENLKSFDIAELVLKNMEQ